MEYRAVNSPQPLFSTYALCVVLAVVGATLAALTILFIALAGGTAVWWAWATSAPALLAETGAVVTGLLGALNPRHRVQFGAAALLCVKAALALTAVALLVFAAVVSSSGD